MAFVFRSEKKSLPSPQQQLNELKKVSKYNEKAEKQKQGFIHKGLPHILQKQHTVSYKENFLPDMQALPIHSPSTFNFNNTIFKSRDFSDAKISHHASEAEFTNKSPLTIKELPQKKIPFKSNNIVNKLAAVRSQKVLTKTVEEKQSIVNKNLLKTMMNMTQKYQETNELNKIAINESKQVDKSMRKIKFKGWQSLKKLSPIKEHKGFIKSDQTTETDDLNILCAPKHEKPQKGDQRLQKATIVKQKQSIQKDQSSQQQGQYEDDAKPGPGAYSYDHLNNKKQFRSKRSKFRKIFYSQIERFKDQQKKFQEVTYVNDEPNSKDGGNRNISVCQSFLSKSPKFKESQEGPVPPPGYYETRQTLQHDLVRNILKSSNTTTFINRSPRLFRVQGKDMPGPGAYTLDRSFQRLLQQRDKLSYSYKSQLQRKLEQSQKKKQATKHKIILDQSGQASVIHVKEDEVLENYYITQAPPFMSSTERFPKLNTLLSSQHYYQRPRQNIPLPIPVKEPFNSSQKRETFGKIGQGVGIGLYNLNKDISKKSYNILFN